MLIAKPGHGKTHWLSHHKTIVDCTTTSHRAALVLLCESLNIGIQNRATIEDLIRSICALQTKEVFAFDNVDRTSPKFLYTLLELSKVHDVYITATEKKKVNILIDRQSAILHPTPALPSSKIKEIVHEKFPTLTSGQVEKITSLSSSPASAMNLANAIDSGEMKNLPIPPSKNILPLLAIVIIAVIAFIRYEAELNPVTMSIITALGLYMRRVLWKVA
jgi:hypothetical protein